MLIYFMFGVFAFVIFFCARADETCGNGYTLASTDGIAYFSMLHTRAGKCDGGYVPYVLNYDAAFPVADSPMRCGAGYYPTPNGCASHATENCPDNYYAITPAVAFVRGDANDECGTNYFKYNDTDFCRKYLGANMAEICVPQLACTAGVTTLHTLNGIVLPLYAEQITTPSMHFGLPGGNVCHANMVGGTVNGTINVRYNDETYHVVE